MAAILTAVRAAYGSLDQPNYSFVSDVVRDEPYARLVAALSKQLDVEDVTDINDDVSFRYVIGRRGRRWTLDLSMVGSYGLLMRLAPRPTVVVDRPVSRRETKLLKLIERAGVTLLPKDVVEAPIQLRRPNQTGGSLVYHALISDESLPPWQVTDHPDPR